MPTFIRPLLYAWFCSKHLACITLFIPHSGAFGNHRHQSHFADEGDEEARC